MHRPLGGPLVAPRPQMSQIAPFTGTRCAVTATIAIPGELPSVSVKLSEDCWFPLACASLHAPATPERSTPCFPDLVPA